MTIKCCPMLNEEELVKIRLGVTVETLSEKFGAEIARAQVIV